MTCQEIVPELREKAKQLFANRKFNEAEEVRQVAQDLVRYCVHKEGDRSVSDDGRRLTHEETEKLDTERRINWVDAYTTAEEILSFPFSTPHRRT